MKATTKTPAKTETKIDIGLSEDQRYGVAEILTCVLADEYVLYTKTRNYHWNIVGLQFRELHKLFEEQYEQLSESIDEVAERIRMLDHQASGTLSEFLEHTRLQEHPGQYPPAREMLANLVADHEAIIRQLREDLEECQDTYHDVGTSDFLLQHMEAHEKMAWMLRAFLEGESV
jgi:starvation-inducible DNA-binding protein